MAYRRSRRKSRKCSSRQDLVVVKMLRMRLTEKINFKTTENSSKTKMTLRTMNHPMRGLREANVVQLKAAERRSTKRNQILKLRK